MLLAMAAAMGLGMALAIPLGLVGFARYFGAMEVMPTTMLSGMVAAMCVGMVAAMRPLGLVTAALARAILGRAVLAATYGANYRLNGRIPG